MKQYRNSRRGVSRISLLCEWTGKKLAIGLILFFIG